ncbi:MAG: sulfatase [Verrucomicrobia bacterium TMED40]|nr:MAG: sulfatase [Verrucomicrobia bacterium TMED40]
MKTLLSILFLINGFTLLSAQKSPNVLYIISDDQAWTDYGFMGHPQIKTPHLDKLSRESVLFERGYVPTALCRPSLVTLINGQYTHKHGVTGNDPSPKNYPPKDGENYNEKRAQLISYLNRFETLPNLLAEKGYLSHQSGKWWEGNFKHGGFTHGMTRGFPQPGGRHGDDGLKIGRNGLQPIEDFVDHSMKENKPFFLWYGVFLPHTPHNPPERLLKPYQDLGLPLSIAKYYAMCTWFDETCGQLVDLLEKRNLRDDTIIVYVTDNGWIQNPEKNGYAPRSKQTPYEGGIRTPIMFSWPNGDLKNGKRKDVVSSIDLFPTILAATGARTPKDLPGLNLLENLKNQKAIKRKGIFGESFAHDIADVENPEDSLIFRWTIEGKWKLLLTYDGEVNRYKSTHPREEKRPQLFNLLKDPKEEKNLAKDNPEVVARLAAKIGKWWPVKERKVLTKWE